MFGESESESPRVPSPWDSLISTPVSSSPATKPSLVSSSPLATTAIIPKLVPEADDGNVEYKLQLLSPSPARFTRLVTQLKWRLLEGGGQAYYELGVADSGALVGLPRAQLEQSLETLEMMAGEIGASVVVVKEIEVPAAMADYAVDQEDHRRIKKRDEFLISSEDESNTSSATETETETSMTDEDDGLQASDQVFSMDPELELGQVTIELEISSVYKPRPVRTKESNNHLTSPDNRHRGKNKKQPHDGKAGRKLARERKKDANRKALEALVGGPAVHEHSDSGTRTAMPSRQVTLEASQPSHETDVLLSGLETLHVSLDKPQAVSISNTLLADDAIPSITLDDGDDDVFAFRTPSVPHATFPKSATAIVIEDGTKDLSTEDLIVAAEDDDEKRLIVEALVVRKMSIEEAFLDFGGFSLI